MNVTEALRNRRSIKKFTDRAVTRAEIVELLEAVTLAPNHHLTQPWRFYVLGPAARRAYGDVLGARKARKVDDAAAGRLVREKVAAEHEALPAMIAIAMRLDENTEKREEDYAAVMMGVQNLQLAALERGLGTHIKTGAVMEDPGARAAVGVGADERIIAIVNIGEPADVPQPKERAPVTAHIAWRD